MKKPIPITNKYAEFYGKTVLRRFVNSVFFLLILFLIAGPVPVMAEWPQVVSSRDGTPISYEVFGNGEPSLVFVHGWCCDNRYWRAQKTYFSRHHRVVMLDLAGHGHSGATRKRYTMKRFGEDVQAVTEAAAGQNVILVGHSMGGSVIAEAARLMPKRVIGLVGVDTLENIEYPMTQAELDRMTAPLKQDFPSGCRGFVSEMILPHSDPKLTEWILADMSAASPEVALSAMEEMMAQYINGDAANIFNQIRIPVVSVCGDLWPINDEANRRHMKFFKAIVIEKADHFLMMNRADEFNPALEKAVHIIQGKTKTRNSNIKGGSILN